VGKIYEYEAGSLSLRVSIDDAYLQDPWYGPDGLVFQKFSTTQADIWREGSGAWVVSPGTACSLWTAASPTSRPRRTVGIFLP
jgi:hypothetical protein